MDTFTDHLARQDNMQRIIEDIGRAIIGEPSVLESDNYGNNRIGSVITCENGETVDLSYMQALQDHLSLVANAELLNRHEGGLGATYILGDLQSPLQTRCETAAEERQR